MKRLYEQLRNSVLRNNLERDIIKAIAMIPDVSTKSLNGKDIFKNILQTLQLNKEKISESLELAIL